MIDTLRHVCRTQLRVEATVLDPYLDTIVRYATEGPLGNAPYIVAGASGLVPIRDVEDLHVLTTALRAPADVLVTNNFTDFASAKDCQLLAPGELAVFPRPDGPALAVAMPKRMMTWLDHGAVALPPRP